MVHIVQRARCIACAHGTEQAISRLSPMNHPAGGVAHSALLVAPSTSTWVVALARQPRQVISRSSLITCQRLQAVVGHVKPSLHLDS